MHVFSNCIKIPLGDSAFELPAKIFYSIQFGGKQLIYILEMYPHHNVAIRARTCNSKYYM